MRFMHRGAWRCVQRSEEVYGDVYTWRCMEVFAEVRRGVHGGVWRCMEVHRGLWGCMEVIGCPLQPLV